MQYGTVLVFKAGTPKHEIEAALDALAPILDKPYVPENKTARAAGITVSYRLQQFDPARGGPVWYIP